MQKTQAAAVASGAVWLTINSSAEGQQGHMSPAEAKAFAAAGPSRRTAYLLDPKGEVGRRYGAKATPHLYVDRPGRHPRLQRRDRRQADPGPGRHRRRPQPRPRRFGRAQGGQESVGAVEPGLWLQRQIWVRGGWRPPMGWRIVADFEGGTYCSPAKAGAQRRERKDWIPAFAGKRKTSRSTGDDPQAAAARDTTARAGSFCASRSVAVPSRHCCAATSGIARLNSQPWP